MNCFSSLILFCLLANTLVSGNLLFQESKDIFQQNLWNNKISRIAGGLDAAEAAFPYQVSLQNYGNHFCGGSILNQKWILTAGHCLSGAGPSQVTVVVGTNDLTQGGIKHKSKRLIVHPNYSGYELINDIGLIELDSPLNFSSKVSNISLPKKDTKIPFTPVVVSGWGQTSPAGDDEMSPVLQYLNLKIVGEKLCRLINKEKVTEKTICTISTLGKGICKGDAGDPVVLDGTYQVGIVSWGVALCGLGVPDVHTRVYSYVDWINDYVNN